MQTTRTPAVAGMLYPASVAELYSQVQTFLSQVQVPAEPPPKAIIAPHAGFVYSGPIAAFAYARFKAARDLITRVVLLGPSHRVGFRGIAVSGHGCTVVVIGDVKR